MSLKEQKTAKAKSPSSKKSDKTLGIIVDVGLRHVVNWTKKELSDLQQSSESPIVVPLSNGGYLVATYQVEKIHSTCWKVNEFEFTNKRSAIFYCALLHTGRKQEADAMHTMDQRVDKYDLDKDIFRARLDSAHLANDRFKIDLYHSRFDESKRNLVAAKKDIEKIIPSAKYLNSLI